MFIFLYEPHGTNKPKIYNRYTQKKRKEFKHNTKDIHQITREERTIRKEQKELQKKPANN